MKMCFKVGNYNYTIPETNPLECRVFCNISKTTKVAAVFKDGDPIQFVNFYTTQYTV